MGWYLARRLSMRFYHLKNFLGNPSQVMFRKKSLNGGGFKEMSLWNADLELFLRVLTVGNCYIIPKVLSYTRVHNATISQAMMRNSWNYLGDYELVKLLKANEENLDLSEINIDQFVKAKAKQCSLAIPHTILGIQKKENRQVFKKAFTIAYNEGVLWDSLLLIASKFFKRVSLSPK